MKDFIRPSGRLRVLPLAARATYSVFLGFTLLALAESAWLGADMLGVDLGGLDSYYAGAPAPSSALAGEPAAGSDGPTLELPSDEPPSTVSSVMPLRKLLEVTHFHLFTMPVYLMVLAHLFMLSRLSAGAKLGWIAAGTLGVALHIIAPWVARAGSAGATPFYALSGALLFVSSAVMSLVALFEMWWPARAATGSAS
ncbi:MAG: hypothetical protein ABW321_06860 [Polyangiales bacterium]